MSLTLAYVTLPMHVQLISTDTSQIDYTHPALGGSFGPGNLVSYGTDLVGDKYDGENTPVPDDE